MYENEHNSTDIIPIFILQARINVAFSNSYIFIFWIIVTTVIIKNLRILTV